MVCKIIPSLLSPAKFSALNKSCTRCASNDLPAPHLKYLYLRQSKQSVNNSWVLFLLSFTFEAVDVLLRNKALVDQAKHAS